jgi:hypothetical protein
MKPWTSVVRGARLESIQARALTLRLSSDAVLITSSCPGLFLQLTWCPITVGLRARRGVDESEAVKGADPGLELSALSLGVTSRLDPSILALT